VGGERVAVRYSKWGGIDHWHFDLEPLGQDRFGWWFFGRKGLTLQRGAEPPVPQRRDFVLLVPVQGCWTACFNAEDELEIYVDVTTRPVLGAGTVTAVDLDLDVVRYLDGRVEVLDEDEFAEHQVQLAYPAELISQARQTCDWLVEAVSSRAEPFGKAGTGWLARARGAARGGAPSLGWQGQREDGCP
jgi:hypothetical protein